MDKQINELLEVLKGWRYGRSRRPLLHGLPQSSDETGRTLQPHQPAERSAHQKPQRHRCLPAKFRCPQHSRYYSPMGGWQRQNVAPHHESPAV